MSKFILELDKQECKVLQNLLNEIISNTRSEGKSKVYLEIDQDQRDQIIDIAFLMDECRQVTNN